MAKQKTQTPVASGSVPTIARVGKLVVGSTQSADVQGALRRSRARRKLSKADFTIESTQTPDGRWITGGGRSAEDARLYVAAGRGTIPTDKLANRLETVANDLETGDNRPGDALFVREAVRILKEASTTLGKQTTEPRTLAIRKPEIARRAM